VHPDAGDAGFSADACPPGIVGRKFGSLGQMECGFGMSGIVYCTWTVDFNAQGGYFWHHSDTPYGGAYRCEGAQILATRPGGLLSVAGQYDSQNERLTWFGAPYAPLPP
jgi:hypothetical protein